MPLTKKGSRRIVVDGVDYRWSVRRKPTYSQVIGESTQTFAVQRTESDGQVLLAVTRDLRPDSPMAMTSVAVTPSQVAAAIRTAVEAGWDPTVVGPPFVLQTD